MSRIACALICAGFLLAGSYLSARPAGSQNFEPVILGVTPAQDGYAPASRLDLPSPALRGTTDPTGSDYQAAALAQDLINPFFIDQPPDSFTWDGTAKNNGDNVFSESSMTLMETYLPGAGASGGDVIQVNIFTDDSSALVPEGSSTPVGRPFLSWRMDVGIGAFNDRIDIDPNAPILSSGFDLFSNGVSMGGPFALNDEAHIGGVGVAGLNGDPIDGVDVDEMAMFWEVQPVEEAPCADLDGDGDIDLDDLTLLLQAFQGDGVPSPGGDVDGDNDTDLDDLTTLLQQFGGTCP
jgi:hypothetical protein